MFEQQLRPFNFLTSLVVKRNVLTTVLIFIIKSNNSNLGRGVQHYVINFVSDLRQVGGFKMVLRFPPP